MPRTATTTPAPAPRKGIPVTTAPALPVCEAAACVALETALPAALVTLGSVPAVAELAVSEAELTALEVAEKAELATLLKVDCAALVADAAAEEMDEVRDAVLVAGLDVAPEVAEVRDEAKVVLAKLQERAMSATLSARQVRPTPSFVF
ncbi:hypothetical protein LTR95_005932 [Oleoguttula sp. CCFEE 5521]